MDKERIYTLFQLAEDLPPNDSMVLRADEVLEITRLALLAHHYQESNVMEVEVIQTAPADHLFRETVNQLRDIAIKYHGTQSLRDRIARALREGLKSK
ncbi:hypothetical protein [Citrobacter werkmanii]|uniref:hypothetical protein n=1 Tax=Citrobacter werkmanii TaxID=67827 RepID=UPI0037CCA529